MIHYTASPITSNKTLLEKLNDIKKFLLNNPLTTLYCCNNTYTEITEEYSNIIPMTLVNYDYETLSKKEDFIGSYILFTDNKVVNIIGKTLNNNTNCFIIGEFICDIKGDKGDTGETGATGATGNGIVSITKTGTVGLVDVYTILCTNGSTSTFNVTNGAKGDVGKNIFYTKSIQNTTNEPTENEYISFFKSEINGLPEVGDNIFAIYRLTNELPTIQTHVYNLTVVNITENEITTQYINPSLNYGGIICADGNGINGIAKTSTVGNVDTYTIIMADHATYTFTVTNGLNGATGKENLYYKFIADIVGEPNPQLNYGLRADLFNREPVIGEKAIVPFRRTDLTPPQVIVYYFTINSYDEINQSYNCSFSGQSYDIGGTLTKDGLNGVGITSISKTGTSGNIDTYTITFTDGNIQRFTVTNGTNGVGVPSGGTIGQVLKKKSGTDYDTEWANDTEGMANPMTTNGAIIYGGAGGSPSSLPIGTAGQILTVAQNGLVPEWQTPSGGGGGTQLYKHMIDMYFVNTDNEELNVLIILTNNSNTEITQISQLRNYDLNAIPIFVRTRDESSNVKELFASSIAGTSSTINFIGIGFENNGNNLSLIDEISLIIADLDDLTDTITSL